MGPLAARWSKVVEWMRYGLYRKDRSTALDASSDHADLYSIISSIFNGNQVISQTKPIPGRIALTCMPKVANPTLTLVIIQCFCDILVTMACACAWYYFLPSFSFFAFYTFHLLN